MLPPLILDGTATQEAETQELSQTLKKSQITSSKDNPIEFRLIKSHFFYIHNLALSLCSAGTSPSDWGLPPNSGYENTFDWSLCLCSICQSVFLELTEQDVPGTYHALQNISWTKWTLVDIVYWKSLVARLENSEQHEGLDGESPFLPLLCPIFFTCVWWCHHKLKSFPQ